MMKKRGDSFQMILVMLVVAVIFLLAAAYFGTDVFKTGRETLGTLSPGASSYSVSACNAYCGYLKGQEVDSVISVTDKDTALQLYCNKIMPFVYVKDGKEKEEKMTCAEVSPKSDGAVLDCSDMCKEWGG